MRDAADRIRAEQIKAVYAAAPTGVIGALAAAFVFAGSISVIDSDYTARALLWAVVLTAVAVPHLMLCRGHRRTQTPDRAAWPIALCLFYVAEGLTWSWIGVRLAPPDRVYDQLMAYLLLGTVASASVTALASYLPAFHAFFLSALIPLVVQGLTAHDAYRRIGGVLAALLIVTMIVLAHRFNRSFVDQLRLRYEAQDLAYELRRQTERAEQASLSKSRFLASASHDLRQPVHALGMFVGALKARQMDAEARRLVDHIQGSVASMDDLFGALLDISRLDAGVVDVDATPFAIQRLIDRICRELDGEAAGKGVRLVAHPCSAIVQSDPVLLERVLRNIVGNAVRYTDCGRVVVGCRRRGRLLVQVWDTGRGIPKDRQEAVFDEFYQLDNTERDRAKGLGLGLAIVKRLTTLLKHELTVCSRPGRGSVFSVAVPYAAASAGAVEVSAQPALAIRRRGLIVVVDDETLIQEAMRSLLVSWGHTVIVAGSGAEILQRLADCPTRPDLVICDYRLRDEETGVEVIEALQSEYNEDIPGMLITGDTAPDRLLEARESGFLLLHKPVADAKLRAAIGNLLQAAPPEPGDQVADV